MTGPNSCPISSSAMLDREQADQDRDGDRHDEFLELRRDQLEALHR
jgi:hypothetical protein